jgi:hypothetical protein
LKGGEKMSENKLQGNCPICDTYNDEIKLRFANKVLNVEMNNCEHIYPLGEINIENTPKGEDGQFRVKVGFTGYNN